MVLVKRFEDLEAWRAARALTARPYTLTRQERFSMHWGLSGQFRRAAVSTMCNIAEGFDSGSRTEFRRFLRYAARSSSEVRSYLYAARDQDYLSQADFDEVYLAAGRVRRLCSGLIRRIGRRATSGRDSDRIAESAAVYGYTRMPAPPHSHTPAL